MRHLRFLLSAAIITMLSSSLLAQTASVVYYMNSGAPALGFFAGNPFGLSLSATNFIPSVAGTNVPGTNVMGPPVDWTGPGTTNEALRQSGNWSFSFSVTNNDTSNWDINNWGFNLLYTSGASNAVAQLFSRTPPAAFALADTQNTISTAPNWTVLSANFSPPIILVPGQTQDFRIDFSGFTANFDIDSVFLTGAVVAIPEPATIALIGLTGVAGVGGWYIRRHRNQKALNAAFKRV